jgi:hypothetical protein
VAQLNQLRVLLKKSIKPAPLTREQRDAKRRAQRQEYKATVLAYGIAQWDADAARLRAEHGPSIMVEFGIGFRPTEYTPRLADRYERRNNR